MLDAFARLGFPARPWIDPELLKGRFHSLAATAHPDSMSGAGETARAGAGRDFAELSAAHTLLRSHRDRLALLWEIETGRKAETTADIPADLAPLFMEVGQICRAAEQFLAARSKLASPMLKAQAHAEVLEWTSRLQALQGRIASLNKEFEENLRRLDAEWDGLDAPRKHAALGASHFRASCLQRWQEQLRERISQLAF